MSKADVLAGASDKAFIAELQRRFEQSPDFLEQAQAALTKGEVRPDVERTLTNEDEPAPDASESSETENLNQELVVYRQEYTSLPNGIKARASWEAITERLLENDSEKLKLAKNMQGEGQLVGIDVGGKALFKDKGVEPVIYGFDKEDKLLKIYNRDPKQMKQVEKWVNYFEVREQVLKDGYELFADDGYYDFSDEMKQVTEHTGEPFVASEDRKKWRVSWLESGDKPVNARTVSFKSAGGNVLIFELYPEYRSAHYGAARLLRV